MNIASAVRLWIKKKKSVLFVCTGNVFRSMSAEYCFKHYLKENNIYGWSVGSAGIRVNGDPIPPAILEILNSLGINSINHKSRQLTSKLLGEYSVIIAMAEDHINFMKREFGFNGAVLFDDISYGQKKSIEDVTDKINESNRRTIEKRWFDTISHINESIPRLFRKLSVEQ